MPGRSSARRRATRSRCRVRTSPSLRIFNEFAHGEFRRDRCHLRMANIKPTKALRPMDDTEPNPSASLCLALALMLFLEAVFAQRFVFVIARFLDRGVQQISLFGCQALPASC